MDDLRGYFNERRKVSEGAYEPRDQEHFDVCEQAFKMHRYQLLYRRWLAEGDRVFDYVSEGLTTALESGAGRIETVVLPHSVPSSVTPGELDSAKATGGREGRRKHRSPSAPRPRATHSQMVAS
jgi:hypothetical protein